VTGRLRVGTSGFAYPDWAPRFYPAGLRGNGLLHYYASRFAACELNNTFYRRPSAERLRAWRDATPEDFRFAIKAQKGATFRIFAGATEDRAASVAWLTEDLPALGDRLGAVLFRIPDPVERDDDRLAGLLEAWPPTIPLVVELQHESWHCDETYAALAAARACLCATELPEGAAPDLRLTGGFLYLRLRREDYAPADVGGWAERLRPFLDAGVDAYAFFRHDADGRSTELAEALAAAVAVGRQGSRVRCGRGGG
jgi:uncharacterized protein YecE (DUF72 family)